MHYYTGQISYHPWYKKMNQLIKPDDIPDPEIRDWFKNKIDNESSCVIEQFNDKEEEEQAEYANKYPSVLEIESTSRCNVNPACPMCERAHRSQDDERDMPSQIVSWLTNPIAVAKSISISGVGEPMMSKEFDRMVAMSSMPAAVNFFSNGQVLTPKNIDLILSKPVNHIDFSMDAATPETYRKIRGYDLLTFGTVTSNIQKLVKERNRRGLNLPSIHLIMVVMKINYGELPDLVTLAHKLGVDGVRYWMMRRPKSDHANYRDHYRNDFFFSYVEQSEVPDDYAFVLQDASRRAEKYGLMFMEN